MGYLVLGEEIPAVACNIDEYGDLAVRLGAWFGNELNTSSQQPLVRQVEVIDPQKQSNPPGKLLADDSSLTLTISLS